MRYLLAAMLVLLISCHNNEQPRPATTPTPTPTDSLLAAHPGAFHDQDGSSVVFLPDSQVTYIRNVTYAEQFLSRGTDLTHFMVKQTRAMRTWREAEGVDSWITVDIFDIPSRTLLHRWTTAADDVTFQTRYLQTVKYGCCGAENACQLTDIWTDNVFLPYNEKYAIIDVPNGGIRLFVGYLSDARDEHALVHGELILAHEIARPGGKDQYASFTFRTVNRIRFAAKKADFYNEVNGFSPSITLLRNGEKDEVVDYPDRQELRLWSYDFHTSPAGLNCKPLRLVFENSHPIVVEIPLENGLFYGDTTGVRTVYLDEH